MQNGTQTIVVTDSERKVIEEIRKTSATTLVPNLSAISTEQLLDASWGQEVSAVNLTLKDVPREARQEIVQSEIRTRFAQMSVPSSNGVAPSAVQEEPAASAQSSSRLVRVQHAEWPKIVGLLVGFLLGIAVGSKVAHVTNDLFEKPLEGLLGFGWSAFWVVLTVVSFGWLGSVIGRQIGRLSSTTTTEGGV